jgi:hypothetical protein
MLSIGMACAVTLLAVGALAPAAEAVTVSDCPPGWFGVVVTTPLGTTTAICCTITPQGDIVCQ